ncbi:hypothetical protein DL240_01940 [Lujinxingia litoralis]|uniref:Biopolymer transporter ExbD n=1 Tax=Lujinxingia litoralis TaxID=2211119 RepID=A0A328CBB3_9DELT|nr:biopolymer transporter ExbD [Lujinxingia litoralis]RAL24996.1 hypothetical protein DL240_01940 [Lujinxingia litoralis]
MARRPREEIGLPEDLNLAPMMNLVIILIPMLLLSVVFLEVSVINVTMPVGGAATSDREKPEEDKQPLNLAISMSAQGFYITAAGTKMQPMPGCPTGGPSICLEDDSIDTAARFEEARRLYAADDKVRGEEVLLEGLSAYNYRELYNRLSIIKNEFPEETTVTLTADDKLPFALTTRVMDVVRYRLEEDSYDSNAEFWDSKPRAEGDTYAILFGDPAFGMMQ